MQCFDDIFRPGSSPPTSSLIAKPMREAVPWWRFLVPPAVAFVLVAVAAGQGWIAAAQETRFWALTVTVVLTSVAALARRDATLLIGGLGAVFLVWWGGHGDLRNTAVAMLLVVVLAVATAERARSGDLWLVVIAGGYGLQVLMRPELMLQLDQLRPLVSLFVLPALAAAATAVMARVVSWPVAILAWAVTIVVLPGWNAPSVLTLMALAAGLTLARRDDVASGLWRAVAVVVLLLPLVWSPEAGLPVTLAGVAVALGGVRQGAVASVALAAALVLPDARPWAMALPTALAALAVVPLVVMPAVGFMGGAGAARAWAAVALLVLGARIDSATALAAGLALAVLALPGGSDRPAARSLAFVRRVLPVQALWTTILVWLTAWLAFYPWIRDPAWLDALRLVGPPNLYLMVVMVTAAAVVMTSVAARWRGAVGIGVLALVVAGSSLPVFVFQDYPYPIAIEGENEVWQRELSSARWIDRLDVDTTLINGLGLAAGVVIARIEIDDALGNTVAVDSLRVGDHTSDWAAGLRDSVAAAPAPAPFMHHLDDQATVFARRYRARFDLDAPIAAQRVRIVRNPDLDPSVQFFLYRVELRR